MSGEQAVAGAGWSHEEALSFAALVGADIRAFAGVVDSLLSPGFWAVYSYRLAHALAVGHVDLLARGIQLASLLVLDCDISRLRISRLIPTHRTSGERR